MRRLLRVLGVVGVWAASSFVGPAAHADVKVELTPCGSEPTPSAQPTPSGQPQPTQPPNSQPQNCVPEQDARIVGTQTLNFAVTSNSQQPLWRVNLYIRSEEQGVPSANDNKPVLTQEYPNRNQAPASATFQFNWDSPVLTPYNGIYSVRVVAQAWGFRPDHSDAPGGQASRRLRVDNPPKPVAAPRIVAATATEQSIEWDKATEPDVLSYNVYRAITAKADTVPPYSAFEPLEKTSEPAARHNTKGKGTYWYTVIVTRRSVVTPETGISSPPSPISKPTTWSGKAKAPASSGGGGGTSGGGSNEVFHPRVISRLPRLTLPSVGGRAPPVPDAPFSAYLPYDVPEGGSKTADAPEPGVDPRGAVLPVAVGAFLVSSALALGRMPY
jgi:hypothetical protein